MLFAIAFVINVLAKMYYVFARNLRVGAQYPTEKKKIGTDDPRQVISRQMISQPLFSKYKEKMSSKCIS